MLVNLRTTYEQAGMKVQTSRDVARHYLHGDFAAELVAYFPFALCAAHAHHGGRPLLATLCLFGAVGSKAATVTLFLVLLVSSSGHRRCRPVRQVAAATAAGVLGLVGARR